MSSHTDTDGPNRKSGKKDSFGGQCCNSEIRFEEQELASPHVLASCPSHDPFVCFLAVADLIRSQIGTFF